MPVLIASAPMSASTARVWAAMMAGGSGVDGVDAERVLHGDGGDGAGRIAAERGDGLDVGLDARPAAGVRAGDDQHAAAAASLMRAACADRRRDRQAPARVSRTSWTRTIAAPARAPARASGEGAAERGRRAVVAVGSSVRIEALAAGADQDREAEARRCGRGGAGAPGCASASCRSRCRDRARSARAPRRRPIAASARAGEEGAPPRRRRRRSAGRPAWCAARPACASAPPRSRVRRRPPRLSGAQVRAVTSFHIVAPGGDGGAGDRGLHGVDGDRDVALARGSPRSPGRRGRSPRPRETGAAPGRVDSPPMSRMSAPSAISRAGMGDGRLQRRGSAPPSEKLSGVTLTIPMTSGTASGGCAQRTAAPSEGRVGVSRLQARRRGGDRGRVRARARGAPRRAAPAGLRSPARRGAA